LQIECKNIKTNIRAVGQSNLLVFYNTIAEREQVQNLYYYFFLSVDGNLVTTAKLEAAQRYNSFEIKTTNTL
jgi:hypothetical protein